VGDGPDVLAFSILVQGLRGRGSLGAVRGAQVSCVNAMMRYVRDAQGSGEAAPAAPPPMDVEAGEAVSESEGEATEPEVPTAEDPVDALLRQEQRERAKEEAAVAPPPPGAPAGTPPATPKPATTPASPAKPAPAKPPTPTTPPVAPAPR